MIKLHASKIRINYIVIALASIGIFILVAYLAYRQNKQNSELVKINNNIKQLEQKAKNNPESYEANVEYATALYSLGQNQEAIEHYNLAIEIKEGDPILFNNLGNLYRKQKDYNFAAANYRESIRLAPEQVRAYVNLAHMYIYDLQDKEKGYAVLDDLLRAHPDDDDIKNLVSKTYLQQGDDINSKN